MELNETILAKLALADAVLVAIRESGLLKKPRRRRARRARRARAPRDPNAPKRTRRSRKAAPAAAPAAPADGTVAAATPEGDGAKPSTRVFRRSPDAAPAPDAAS